MVTLPSREVLASTHGDHTVKLTCLKTGRVLKVLEGHLRTPWTVKFNPIDGDIVASGCIGHEVRIWSASKGICLNRVVLNAAAVSLSFYPSPSLHCVAVASSTRVYIWQYTLPNLPVVIKDHKHTVRCVAFPPFRPDLLIVGVDNESRVRRAGRAGLRTLCQLTGWSSLVCYWFAGCIHYAFWFDFHLFLLTGILSLSQHVILSRST